MDKTYQFNAGELYAFQVKAAQAYSDMMVPDVRNIIKQLPVQQNKRPNAEQ